jgi:hypothetical protein
MKSVYSAVRTGSLNKAACASAVNVKFGLQQTIIFWLESVVNFETCKKIYSIYAK